MRSRLRAWVAVFAMSTLMAPVRASDLSERPLRLPTLRAGSPCPVSIGSRNVVPHAAHIFGSGGVWFGDGPVYVSFAWKGDTVPAARFSVSPIPIVDGTRRAKTPWVTEPSFSGPILVRGRLLSAGARPLRFNNPRGTNYALDMQAPHDRPSGADWSFEASAMFIPGPGCYGLQIDTPRKSEHVIFEATP